MKLFLKRIELAGDPSEEEEQADYYLEDAAKHFVMGRRLLTGMLERIVCTAVEMDSQMME